MSFKKILDTQQEEFAMWILDEFEPEVTIEHLNIAARKTQLKLLRRLLEVRGVKENEASGVINFAIRHSDLDFFVWTLDFFDVKPELWILRYAITWKASEIALFIVERYDWATSSTSDERKSLLHAIHMKNFAVTKRLLECVHIDTSMKFNDGVVFSSSQLSLVLRKSSS